MPMKRSCVPGRRCVTSSAAPVPSWPSSELLHTSVSAGTTPSSRSLAEPRSARTLPTPSFAPCDGLTESYALWTCREAVWDEVFRGRTVDGTDFPDDRFSATFFQPFYAGQTFGLGQLNPLTALQMSDLVNAVSGLPRLDADRPNQVYETIIDPDMTLPYVAATIRKAIDAYRTIAGFDISQNPGITATLYNVGNPEARANALRRENETRRAEGLEDRLPEENYYGWLVNEKLAELRRLF